MNRLSILLRSLDCNATRDNYNLNLRNHRGHNKSFIITMNHDHNTNTPRTQSPTILPNKQFLIRFIRIFHPDIKHFGKVLSKTMGCSSLNSTTCRRNKSFDGSCTKSSSKLFVFGFCPLDDGDSEQFLINTTIQLKNSVNFNHSFLLIDMSRMSFLPKEFPSSKERLRMFEFPTNDYHQQRRQ